jgi:hypothetical protein
MRQAATAVRVQAPQNRAGETAAASSSSVGREKSTLLAASAPAETLYSNHHHNNNQHMMRDYYPHGRDRSGLRPPPPQQHQTYAPSHPPPHPFYNHAPPIQYHHPAYHPYNPYTPYNTSSYRINNLPPPPPANMPVRAYNHSYHSREHEPAQASSSSSQALTPLPSSLTPLPLSIPTIHRSSRRNHHRRNDSSSQNHDDMSSIMMTFDDLDKENYNDNFCFHNSDNKRHSLCSTSTDVEALEDLLKSPTSQAFSALLQGASLVVSVPNNPLDDLVSKADAFEPTKTDAIDNFPTFLNDETNLHSHEPCHAKEEKTVLPVKKARKTDAFQEFRPKARRKLQPSFVPPIPPVSTSTNSGFTVSLEDALLHPAQAILSDSNLMREIVIRMALQRESTLPADEVTDDLAPVPRTGKTSYRVLKSKTIVHPGFFWRDFPPLEAALFDNMAQYYQHSSVSTAPTKKGPRDQKAFNNTMVAIIRQIAARHDIQIAGTLYDSDKHLRDRIRCVKRKGLLPYFAASYSLSLLVSAAFTRHTFKTPESGSRP